MSLALEMADQMTNRKLAAELRAIHEQHGPDQQEFQRKANANFMRMLREGEVVEQDGITGVYNDGK